LTRTVRVTPGTERIDTMAHRQTGQKQALQRALTASPGQELREGSG